MKESIRNFFGKGRKTNIRQLVQNGAQIIDVRTIGEFNKGHIPGSVNIPLQDLSRNLSQIKINKTVITCCASGMRSASAKNVLKANGFSEVYNGGGWQSLQNKLS